MTHPPLIETGGEDRQTRARHFASNARSQPKGTLDTYLRPPLVSIRGSQTSLGLDGAGDASAPASVGTRPIHRFHQIGWWVLLRCGRAQKMMPSNVRTTKKPCRVAELLTGLATIFVALTRLSLVGLHPCRAQLRFTRQELFYPTGRPVAGVGTSQPAGSGAQNRQKRLPGPSIQNRQKRLPARSPSQGGKGPGQIRTLGIIVRRTTPQSIHCRF